VVCEDVIYSGVGQSSLLRQSNMLKWLYFHTRVQEPASQHFSWPLRIYCSGTDRKITISL